MMTQRNVLIERATRKAIERVDGFLAGESLGLPSPKSRRIADAQLSHRANSVRLASLFLAFYSTVDPQWDCVRVPVGTRGKHGDKLLAAELTNRQITLHNNITAFGENLGWKGNVASVSLSDDPKFREFSSFLQSADLHERQQLADFMAARFADSRQELRALPPVGEDVLTFAKAKDLFNRLIQVQSEGNIQQFLVAGLLTIHRRRYGIEVRTHHVHAADTYDRTPGDIVELRNGELLRAYEVTIRPDWKNRLPDFRKKMDAFGLSKYVIIASGVNSDEELAEPARLITFLRPQGRDIAVIDIHDFANVMAAELTAVEIRESVNTAFDLLSQPRLCGRSDIVKACVEVVFEWLDARSEND